MISTQPKNALLQPAAYDLAHSYYLAIATSYRAYGAYKKLIKEPAYHFLLEKEPSKSTRLAMINPQIHTPATIRIREEQGRVACSAHLVNYFMIKGKIGWSAHQHYHYFQYTESVVLMTSVAIESGASPGAGSLTLGVVLPPLIISSLLISFFRRLVSGAR